MLKSRRGRLAAPGFPFWLINKIPPARKNKLDENHVDQETFELWILNPAQIRCRISGSSLTCPGTHTRRLLYSLSPVWGAVFATQQPLVARANLVYAERQAAVGNVAARATNQAPLAHPLAVVSSAAHGRVAIPVHFTPGTWTQDRSFLEARSFPSRVESRVGLCVFTFLSTGNAAVALPEHAAEATHALGIPPAVVALPSLRNTQTKVSIAGETPSTGPLLVTHSLERTNGKWETSGSVKMCQVRDFWGHSVFSQKLHA